MAILNIVTYPAPLLHQRSTPIVAVDADIRKLAADMAETMYAYQGVGLAAPQVGVLRRIIVMDPSEKKDALLTLINPEIIARDGEIEWEEGCLSIPEFRQNMTRSQTVTCRFLDLDGQPQEISASDLPAVIIQHEIDHLDGKLIIDVATRLKREAYLKKLHRREASRDAL